MSEPSAIGLVETGPEIAQPLVCFHDATFAYERHPAVHHLSGDLAPGALLAVTGPNGAGKSTLLKALAGQIQPISGSIERFGIPAKDIAYLPQRSEVDQRFPLSVFDLVALGLEAEIGAWGGLNKGQVARVHATLADVGLSGFERRPLSTLSGGQVQRALFARLMLADAKLILLDEPFQQLDQATTLDLIALIKSWRRADRAVVAVLHEPALILAHFPETLLLARELIAWGKSVEVMTPEKIARAQRLCEAWDDAADLCALGHHPAQGHHHDHQHDYDHHHGEGH